jgi:protein-disulfide isomerase
MMNKLAPAAVALVVVAGGAWWYSSQTSAPPVPSLNQAQTADMSGVDLSLVEDVVLGNPDSSVTVIEYASFTCPHCANFHRNVFPQIEANYIDNGQIRWEMREVYFDAYGLWAALVARCDIDRYKGVVEMIYRTQQDWAGSSDGGVVADNLRRLGRTAGLESDQVNACLEDGELAQALVAAYQANSVEHNISSTPSFVINGELHSNMSYADFASTLDNLLGD